MDVSGQGWWIIAGYFALVTCAVWFLVGRQHTKSQFLLAGRSLGPWEAGLTIGATWVWAPAIFVSGQKAFQQGWVGLFWFVTPNILCLLAFAWFAARLRSLYPDGYTLSEYMRKTHSPRVQGVYLVTMSGLAICSFAVNLLAGAKIIQLISGLDFSLITGVLAAGTLVYSMYSGLRSTVLASYVKLAAIAVGGIALMVWVLASVGGADAVRAGLAGKSGVHGSLFDAQGLEVFLTFGLPVTIGLMAGPFGDQSFWQRSFATERRHIVRSFMIGAATFAVVPLGMSLLGFAAAGTGFVPKDPQLVNFEMIAAHLPPWTLVLFVFMVLACLCSVLDANMCAIASFVGHDGTRDWHDNAAVLRKARWGMFWLALGGVAIANIPGLQILHLFLFYGTLRASTLMPTILTLIRREWMTEAGVFWGVCGAVAIGLPLFAYGNVVKQWPLIVGGSLTTMLLPVVVILLMRRVRLAQAREALARGT